MVRHKTRHETIPFMVIAALFMLLALLSGIFRLMSENGIGPILLAPLYGLHPILMVFGFIVGIITTERIAGLELLPASRGFEAVPFDGPFRVCWRDIRSAGLRHRLRIAQVHGRPP